VLKSAAALKAAPGGGVFPPVEHVLAQQSCDGRPQNRESSNKRHK
jgi:hypothetical protein